MKKVLIGCGAAALVLAIVLGVVVWKFVGLIKQMSPRMKAVSAAYSALDQDFRYTPPADGLLDESRLSAWLASREALAREISNFDSANGKSTKPFQMMAAIGARMADIAQAHAKALREQNMSLKESLWISERVAGALQSARAQADPQIKSLAQEMEAQSAPGAQGANAKTRLRGAKLLPDQIDHTLKLIKGHEKEMRGVMAAFLADGLLQAGPGASLDQTAPAAKAKPATAPASSPAAEVPAAG